LINHEEHEGFFLYLRLLLVLRGKNTAVRSLIEITISFLPFSMLALNTPLFLYANQMYSCADGLMSRQETISGEFL